MKIEGKISFRFHLVLTIRQRVFSSVDRMGIILPSWNSELESRRVN